MFRSLASRLSKHRMHHCRLAPYAKHDGYEVWLILDDIQH